MPEFAEVNKQVRWLRERALGATVSAFGYHGGHFPALKDDPAKDDVLRNFFEGATVDDITQRGKHVVMRLSTGTLLSHLMFKGRWSMAGDDFVSHYKHHKEPPTAKSVNFWMETSRGRVNFHEPEYKGKVHAFPNVSPGDVEELRALGPEVLVTPETDPAFTAEWTADDLARAAAKTKTAIKALLLDQKKQAGIGNMYACECLYRARVAPERPANALSADEVARVHAELQATLRLSIDTDLDYDRVLLVYRRESDPLGNPVECSEVGGRDTFWVPAVQA
ncbi:MAG: DNA-formamidopyrimidine glycosylase family protein [Polyangiales bacterium]